MFVYLKKVVFKEFIKLLILVESELYTKNPVHTGPVDILYEHFSSALEAFYKTLCICYMVEVRPTFTKVKNLVNDVILGNLIVAIVRQICVTSAQMILNINYHFSLCILEHSYMSHERITQLDKIVFLDRLYLIMICSLISLLLCFFWVFFVCWFFFFFS